MLEAPGGNFYSLEEKELMEKDPDVVGSRTARRSQHGTRGAKYQRDPEHALSRMSVADKLAVTSGSRPPTCGYPEVARAAPRA